MRRNLFVLWTGVLLTVLSAGGAGSVTLLDAKCSTCGWYQYYSENGHSYAWRPADNTMMTFMAGLNSADALPPNIDLQQFANAFSSYGTSWNVVEPNCPDIIGALSNVTGPHNFQQNAVWYNTDDFQDEFDAFGAATTDQPPYQPRPDAVMVAFNSGGGVWSQSCAPTTCSGMTRLNTVILHELGHVVGLDDNYSVHPGTCVERTEADNCIDASVMSCVGYYGGPWFNEPQTKDDIAISTLYANTKPKTAPMSALLNDYGAFGTTVYLETLVEENTAQIMLHGFASAGDYPSAPDTIAVLAPLGGYGLVAHYVVTNAGARALYEWVETDSFGVSRSSPGFAASDEPDGWAERYGAASVSIDSLAPSEAMTIPYANSVMEGEIAAGDSSLCGDFVVYSYADSMADPVVAQIAADNPGKRVIKLLAHNSNGAIDFSANECRRRLFGTWWRNAEWNQLWGASSGRTFPTHPGPEVYIVGAYWTTSSLLPRGVGMASFADTSGYCGHNDCRSDLLIYDIDGDGLPEGPISRLPAYNVSELGRMVTAASDFNAMRWVSPTGRVIVFAGDADAEYKSAYAENIRQQYAQYGLAVQPLLRSSSYAYWERFAPFAEVFNTGAREVFGLDGETGVNTLSGAFVSCDQWGLVEKQRSIGWFPNCNVHAYWQGAPYYHPCQVVRNWLKNDLAKSALAASVAHMDIGRGGNHLQGAAYLARARTEVPTSDYSTSVARVLFNAVLVASAETPRLRDHMLALSAQGSYVRVNPGPVFDPVPVSNLVLHTGRTTAALSWSEPGQNGNAAEAYEIRYHVNTPMTEGNFASGDEVDSPPAPGGVGTPHCLEMSGLVQCCTYYVGIKTRYAGVWSTVSNIAVGSTKCSGYSLAFCDGDGLLVGGGGGEEGASALRLASTSGDVQAVSFSNENSLLWWDGSGREVADIQRIATRAELGASYPVTVREIGRRQTHLDQVRLGAVDHAPGRLALAGAGQVVVGAPGAVMSVRGSEGSVRISSETPYVPRSGEVLEVELGPARTDRALVLDTHRRLAGAKTDSLGIRVERGLPDGTWALSAVVHPRREFDRFAIPAQGSPVMRVTFLGSYPIRAVEALEDVEVVMPTALTLSDAAHSRLGTVSPAISDSGDTRTSLLPGDSLALEFAATQIPAGLVRSLFLTAKGSFERLDGEEALDAPADRAVANEPILEFSLGAAYPNPSDGTVTIAYTLARQVPTVLRVYNVVGREVRTLVDQEQAAGRREALWDMRDNGGRTVSSGVYFYRLQAGPWRSERKLIVIQ